jgi:cytochrome b pre-mRNA-processing protein 3
MSLFTNIKDIFKTPYDHKAATALYVSIVEQSRMPLFYQDFQVADTMDGRFDMVALHAGLTLRSLRREPDQTDELAQAVFDLMFADMDQNLRELSIGDTGVSKRIQKMVSGFYGRLKAYDLALDMTDGEQQRDELKKVIIRNIYRKTLMSDDSVDAMASYILSQVKNLQDQNIKDMLDGRVVFLAPVYENRAIS